MSCEQETAATLRRAGQKVTPQRMLILSSVRHAHGHVTAAQILDEVRAVYPFVDVSTVYRTLAAAKDLRLVSETNLGAGDNLFEWIGGNPHHHLICRECGNVASVDEDELRLLFGPLETSTGFRVDLEHVAIFGTCKRCLSIQTGV
jgi:Fur family ferric uptake transcriptional regulator